MPTPSTRTPVRIARGSYSNLNGSVSDLQDGEISYAEDQNKLYIKEGTSLVSLTFAPASPTFTGDVTFTGAANNVVFDASDNALEFADNAKAIFGAGSDLEIYHAAGAATHINAIGFLNIDGTTGVRLEHNNSTRLTTNAAGVEIGGNLSTASGSSFTINAGGTSGTAANFLARCGSENAIVATANGSVDLYHNNVKTFATASHGIEVLGPEGGTANVYMYADEGDDNADKWGLEVDTSGNFNIRNYSTGSWVDGLTLDGSNNATFASAIYGPAKAVSALQLDLNTGNYFTKTISGNSTFTFANPAASGTVTAFTLELTHSSGTITWPSSVVWNGGVGKTAPTVTAGKTHLFMFVTDDAGTTYRGSALVDYDNAA